MLAGDKSVDAVFYRHAAEALTTVTNLPKIKIIGYPHIHDAIILACKTLDEILSRSRLLHQINRKIKGVAIWEDTKLFGDRLQWCEIPYERLDSDQIHLQNTVLYFLFVQPIQCYSTGLSKIKSEG